MEQNAHLQALLHFLQQPSSFPHRPRQVELIQTHASLVAIAPPFVFKCKKPFDFGFMDFRSLQARKENAEKELTLNRRLCEGVYLDVLPLHRKGQQLSFQPVGPVCDYSLRMKQLEDGYFLHQLARKGALTPILLEPVLQKLKKFYEEQPADPVHSFYASLEVLKQNAEENFNSLRRLGSAIIEPQALKDLEQRTGHFLKEHQSLFRRRQQEGKIKGCHGDLHLEHIHMQNGQVCIYDCIEFNNRFRYSDPAADIAFLLMDLDHAGHPWLATHTANRMAALLQDPDMLLLFDYYKSYRACVRAKVEGLRALQQEVTEEERRESHQKARKYMQLALRYCSQDSS